MSVLKWPFHLWFMDALVKVFPDARIIQTHRSLSRALPSLCSLSVMVQGTALPERFAGYLQRFPGME